MSKANEVQNCRVRDETRHIRRDVRDNVNEWSLLLIIETLHFCFFFLDSAVMYEYTFFISFLELTSSINYFVIYFSITKFISHVFIEKLIKDKRNNYIITSFSKEIQLLFGKIFQLIDPCTQFEYLIYSVVLLEFLLCR